MSRHTAWLIESENNFYVCVNAATYKTPRLGWTGHHDKAIRFARKEDAEAIVLLLPAYGLCLPPDAKGATEHSWESENLPARSNLRRILTGYPDNPLTQRGLAFEAALIGDYKELERIVDRMDTQELAVFMDAAEMLNTMFEFKEPKNVQ